MTKPAAFTQGDLSKLLNGHKAADQLRLALEALDSPAEEPWS